MTHAMDLDLERPTLPRLHFQVTIDFKRVEVPPEEWSNSEIPGLLSLAADIISVEIIKERADFAQRHRQRPCAIKLCIGRTESISPWDWYGYTLGEDGPLSDMWLPMGTLRLTPAAEERVNAVIGRALTLANRISFTNCPDMPAALEYGASWKDLSNHQRLHLEAKAEVPIDALRDFLKEPECLN